MTTSYDEMCGEDLGLDGLDDLLNDLGDLVDDLEPMEQEPEPPKENAKEKVQEKAKEDNSKKALTKEVKKNDPEDCNGEGNGTTKEASVTDAVEDEEKKEEDDAADTEVVEGEASKSSDSDAPPKPSKTVAKDSSAPPKPKPSKGAKKPAKKAAKALPSKPPASTTPIPTPASVPAKVEATIVPTGPVPGTSEVHVTVECLLPTGQTITFDNVPVDSNIAHVQAMVVEKTEEEEFTSLPQGIDNFVVKVGGQVVAPEDHLADLESIQQNLEGKKVTKFTLVDREKEKMKQNKLVSVQISTLLGRKSPVYDDGVLNEVVVFRSRIVPLIKAEMQQRKAGVYQFAPHVTQAALPASIAQKIEGESQLIRLHLNNTAQHKTVKWDLTKTPEELLDSVMNDNSLVKNVENFDPEETYMLKAYGIQDYLIGDHSLYKFFHVRKALLKHTEVHISIVTVTFAKRANSAAAEGDMYLLEDPPQFLLNQHDHQELTIARDNVDAEAFSLWDINRKYSIVVDGVDGLSYDAPSEKKGHGHKKEKSNFRTLKRKSVKAGSRLHLVYSAIGMYYGSELLVPMVCTKPRLSGSDPRFHERLWFDIDVRDVPQAARLCVTSFACTTGVPDPISDPPLAWANLLIVDHLDYLRSGRVQVPMWQWAKANPIGTTEGNPNFDAPVLNVTFDEYLKPVAFPQVGYEEPAVRDRVASVALPNDSPSDAGVSRIDEIVSQNPLYKLSRSDKDLLWQHRMYIMESKPFGLCKLLRAVPWNSVKDVQELYRLLPKWPQFDNPLDALELLDADYPDSRVRYLGTENLNRLDDDEIMDYLIQLVQALKYENYLDNPLIRFLIRRSLRSRLLGHQFFWCLKSEMHLPNVAERFGHYLEAYLRGCGAHRHQLLLQVNFVNTLIDSALYIKNDSDRNRAKLQDKLNKIPFKEQVQLVHRPSLEVSGIRIPKCKFMDSKKLPLWLVLENYDRHGDDVYVIFKEGDDLRQDMLTLQMIGIMDKLWQQNDLDLRMIPYGAVSTGDEQGFIEVVPSSNTIANIQMEHGGARSAFKDEPLAKWLQKYNTNDSMYKEAVENFVYSCAGYAVATYVLGIGDRHNDNIMMQEDGHLFHIDFGHFLGNVKSKFGVKRERTPFVFTPDMVYVMGGKDSAEFKLFMRLCCDAFNVLRQNANMLINLFAMMLSTGIPELTSSEDIEYLTRVLALEKSDEEAREFFHGLVEECLAKGWTTQLNWWIHNVVHGNK